MFGKFTEQQQLAKPTLHAMPINFHSTRYAYKLLLNTLWL